MPPLPAVVRVPGSCGYVTRLRLHAVAVAVHWLQFYITRYAYTRTYLPVYCGSCCVGLVLHGSTTYTGSGYWCGYATFTTRFFTHYAVLYGLPRTRFGYAVGLRYRTRLRLVNIQFTFFGSHWMRLDYRFYITFLPYYVLRLRTVTHTPTFCVLVRLPRLRLRFAALPPCHSSHPLRLRSAFGLLHQFTRLHCAFWLRCRTRYRALLPFGSACLTRITFVLRFPGYGSGLPDFTAFTRTRLHVAFCPFLLHVHPYTTLFLRGLLYTRFAPRVLPTRCRSYAVYLTLPHGSHTRFPAVLLRALLVNTVPRLFTHHTCMPLRLHCVFSHYLRCLHLRFLPFAVIRLPCRRCRTRCLLLLVYDTYAHFVAGLLPRVLPRFAHVHAGLPLRTHAAAVLVRLLPGYARLRYRFLHLRLPTVVRMGCYYCVYRLPTALHTHAHATYWFIRWLHTLPRSAVAVLGCLVVLVVRTPLPLLPAYAAGSLPRLPPVPLYTLRLRLVCTGLPRVARCGSYGCLQHLHTCVTHTARFTVRFTVCRHCLYRTPFYHHTLPTTRFPFVPRSHAAAVARYRTLRFWLLRCTFYIPRHVGCVLPHCCAGYYTGCHTTVLHGSGPAGYYTYTTRYGSILVRFRFTHYRVATRYCLHGCVYCLHTCHARLTQFWLCCLPHYATYGCIHTLPLVLRSRGLPRRFTHTTRFLPVPHFPVCCVTLHVAFPAAFVTLRFALVTCRFTGSAATPTHALSFGLDLDSGCCRCVPPLLRCCCGYTTGYVYFVPRTLRCRTRTVTFATHTRLFYCDHTAYTPRATAAFCTFTLLLHHAPYIVLLFYAVLVTRLRAHCWLLPFATFTCTVATTARTHIHSCLRLPLHAPTFVSCHTHLPCGSTPLRWLPYTTR